MAKKLYSLKDLDRKDWLKLRQEGVGGSEIGAIADVNDYSSPLKVYVSKTTDLIVDEDNNYMKWGRLLEDVIAKQFEEESEELTGHKFTVRNDNFVYADDEYDYMRASIDRRLNNDELGQGILEVKTTTGMNMDEWADDDMPDSYRCQLQWYLGIRGFDYGYIVALNMVTREMVVRRVDFDKEFFEALREIAKNFWNNYVLPGDMPSPSGKKCDDETIALLNGEVVELEEEDIDETEEMANMINLRFALKDLIKEKQTDLKTIEQKLKIRIGNNTRMTTRDYYLTYKPDKNGRRSLRFKKRG